MNSFQISIVIPCFNEEENIPLLINSLEKNLFEYEYEVVLVNDGSIDKTQQIIESLSLCSERIKYISFSRNFGHQKAIKAGIDNALGDCVITMDADLQHPPDAIPEMVSLWRQGYDVVTGVRNAQAQPYWLKRIASRCFYWALSKISDRKVIADSSDFRLIDKKIVDIIRQVSERDLYLRGLFSWIGYRQTTLIYTEGKRIHGKTKYTIKKMVQLASNGITSSSIRPLRFALSIGVSFALLAFGYGVYAIIVMLLGLTVSGWTSIVASIVFLSGVQLIVLGVIGEYLGKMYMESKQRPSYLVTKTNIEKTISYTIKKEGGGRSVII